VCGGSVLGKKGTLAEFVVATMQVSPPLATLDVDGDD